MNYRILLALTSLFPIIWLSGCSSTQTLTKPQVITSNLTAQYVELLPAELLQPCIVPTFAGNTWGDLYKYTVDLQYVFRTCAVTHNALVDLLNKERARLFQLHTQSNTHNGK
ncbi:Rz1-like lysis system protein LysC [Psittacicella hinzii]|uniref:Rz1-like lysis system protein LysC n=1 Tax=Psittacicella hinzii TaxID=2028575 RepID=UPI003CCC8C8F